MRRHVETMLADLLPHPSDIKAFKKLYSRLYLRHPDRTLTTALRREEDVAREWTGRMPFENTQRITSALLAPSAIRSPISRVRQAIE